MLENPVQVLVAVLTSITVVAGLRLSFPPPKRLSGRVRPYTERGAMLINPGLSPDMGGSAPMRMFAPMVLAAAQWVGRMVDRMGEEQLGLRLRQARCFPGRTDRDRVASYRIKMLWTAVVFAGMGAGVGVLLRQSTAVVLSLSLVLAVSGVLRVRGRVDRALRQRRSVMRIEIATVNQLLAILVRSGSGALHAVGELTARGRGEVIGELGEALRMHRSGISAGEAFRRLAETTPEPHCARTYKLLSTAEEMGADLTAGLRALADDARRARREALRRSATRRRSAMLVPTIAILAPVMLLFVAAPLPQLVLGWK